MMMMHERGWEMFVLDETDRQTDRQTRKKNLKFKKELGGI